MATIVLGAVGAYFGGNLGYMIGSAIGSYIDQSQIPATQVQGPRLGDLKVQTSNYGKPVASIHGATRVAGNLIWSTNLIETAHEQSQGGKGGGPQTNTTTYTYSQSFAIALCEGTIAGVGRIWASGKLIYNVTASADPATVAASQAMASSIRFYTGSETQTPDSLIQAHIGASNTPAYRGTAYVVFENMQLADYGNRMPNMEFEVIEVGTVAHPAGEVTSYGGVNNPAGVAFDPVTKSVWVVNFIGDSVTKYNPVTGAYTTFPTVAQPRSIVFDPVSNAMWVGGQGALNGVVKHDINSGAILASYAVPNAFALAFDSATGAIWVAQAGYGQLTRITIATGALATVTLHAPTSTYYYGIAFDPVTNSIWACDNNFGVLYRVSVASLSVVKKYDPTVYGAYGSPYGAAFDPISNSIWITFGGTTVIQKNVLTDADTLHTLAASSTPHGIVCDPVTASMWTANYGGLGVSKINIASGAVVNYTVGVNPSAIAFDSYTNAVWTPYGSSFFFTARVNIRDWGITSTPPALSAVVSGICTRAGLSAGQLDVTQLTDTLDGYVTQRSSARAMIEQLMQAFYFDAVESDGKVKFVKRGGATALTIAEDDLAAYLHGGAMPDNLQIDRKQEMELPVEVNVQYLDEASSYQINSQRSQRLTTNSVNKLSINFALSLTASKAKQISDVLMYDAWTARMSFALHNSWKYSYLEPTDVIGVVKTGRTYNVRLIDEDASGGVYTRGAVLEDSAVYTQTANAAAPVTPGITVKGAATINLMLMDIPLLRDQDDAIGFYIAACAYSGTWQGEQTFKSNDSGASWTQSGQGILNQATIGAATSVLGDFTGRGNIFDEGNSVTVVLAYGTLASDTELNVLNGSNVILIGGEIIQFKNAALIAANTYTLTGLLRGRRGTEWAMASHAIGDRAVLLSSTTTYLFSSSSSEYNLARKYKGVSIGGFLADAVTQTFTNTAVAQECYSPVQLGGGRNAANDVLLTWIRRTRIGGAWNDYADVPLGEAAEAYTVEIYSSNTYVTLKRTITGITSPSTTYTAAQQTADGLTPGNPVYFIVYQVSATVGTGYGARGVV